MQNKFESKIRRLNRINPVLLLIFFLQKVLQKGQFKFFFNIFFQLTEKLEPSQKSVGICGAL